MRAKRDLRDRLFSRTRPEGDCIVRIGYASRSGHMQIYVDGRMQIVSRVAWELHNGQQIPDGQCVRHTCDNPPCVKREHLILGTVADNNRDRDERGRHRALRGEDNGYAKLTDDGVRRIRELLASGMPQRWIANELGVHQATVSLINRGKIWRHVA